MTQKKKKSADEEDAFKSVVDRINSDSSFVTGVGYHKVKNQDIVVYKYRDRSRYKILVRLDHCALFS
jgi:hypothetical protein